MADESDSDDSSQEGFSNDYTSKNRRRSFVDKLQSNSNFDAELAYRDVSSSKSGSGSGSKRGRDDDSASEASSSNHDFSDSEASDSDGGYNKRPVKKKPKKTKKKSNVQVRVQNPPTHNGIQVLGGAGGGPVGQSLEVNINNAPADNDEDADENWEAQTFTDLERQRAGQGQECWGCLCNYGPIQDASIQPHRDKLWKVFAQNKGDMDDFELAVQISKAHEELIFNEMTRRGIDTIKWPARMVFKHLKYHMLDVSVEAVDDVKAARMFQRVLQDQVMEENTVNGKSRTNADNAKLWLQLSKFKYSCLRVNPEKCIRFEPTLNQTNNN